MNKPTSIPVPMSMRELINSNNKLLELYQKELTAKVFSANEEMMQMMNLDPADGWRLDLSTMTYVKQEPNVDDNKI